MTAVARGVPVLRVVLGAVAVILLPSVGPADPEMDRLLTKDEKEDEDGKEDTSVIDEVMDMDDGAATIERLLAAAATAVESKLLPPFPPLVPGALRVKSESSVIERPTDQSTSKTAER